MRQAVDLLEGLIPTAEDGKDIGASHLEKIIVFAIMWSIGSLLELDDRKKVHISYLFSLCNWQYFVLITFMLCKFSYIFNICVILSNCNDIT